MTTNSSIHPIAKRIMLNEEPLKKGLLGIDTMESLLRAQDSSDSSILIYICWITTEQHKLRPF